MLGVSYVCVVCVPCSSCMLCISCALHSYYEYNVIHFFTNVRHCNFYYTPFIGFYNSCHPDSSAFQIDMLKPNKRNYHKRGLATQLDMPCDITSSTLSCMRCITTLGRREFEISDTIYYSLEEVAKIRLNGKKVDFAKLV